MGWVTAISTNQVPAPPKSSSVTGNEAFYPGKNANLHFWRVWQVELYYHSTAEKLIKVLLGMGEAGYRHQQRACAVLQRWELSIVFLEVCRSHQEPAKPLTKVPVGLLTANSVLSRGHTRTVSNFQASRNHPLHQLAQTLKSRCLQAATKK